jgi:hypothetical protein
LFFTDESIVIGAGIGAGMALNRRWQLRWSGAGTGAGQALIWRWSSRMNERSWAPFRHSLDYV